MDENQALAGGLIAGGVRFGAGYPITPWSSVMEILRSEFPKYGGLFVQCEDELSAVSMALGFSYSGNLAITGERGAGHFVEGRSDRLGHDGGDSAHRRERAARRTEHRPPDECRAERFAAGDLPADTAIVRTWCSQPRRSKIVSTSRSEAAQPANANTTRRFSF